MAHCANLDCLDCVEGDMCYFITFPNFTQGCYPDVLDVPTWIGAVSKPLACPGIGPTIPSPTSTPVLSSALAGFGSALIGVVAAVIGLGCFLKRMIRKHKRGRSGERIPMHAYHQEVDHNVAALLLSLPPPFDYDGEENEENEDTPLALREETDSTMF